MITKSEDDARKLSSFVHTHEFQTTVWEWMKREREAAIQGMAEASHPTDMEFKGRYRALTELMEEIRLVTDRAEQVRRNQLKQVENAINNRG